MHVFLADSVYFSDVHSFIVSAHVAHESRELGMFCYCRVNASLFNAWINKNTLLLFHFITVPRGVQTLQKCVQCGLVDAVT